MSLTPLELLDYMKERLIELTRDMQIGDNKKAPNVHIGYLPQKISGPKEQPPDPAVPVTITGVNKNNQVLDKELTKDVFPFIIIRATGVDDSEYDQDGQAQADIPVKILIATYSYDEDGYRDVMHLAQVIRQNFITTGTMGAAADLQRPVSFVLHEEQAYPYWSGEFMTTWAIPTLERKVDFINGYTR
ncbi:hypothetical protein [Paenibacillus sp. UASWS1643]|uniref:hypothetical protein n=1 Tax=Paenibacillus sp. UASWS1643 TaxID=2580422 RepID=UPI00123B0802|nr:hypothetical protein [Paenibacillus sp. UASWS1643]KAA8750100.1 hypothetical protein FE296_16005 [Paenibacillus sp. UASWS1643]